MYASWLVCKSINGSSIIHNSIDESVYSYPIGVSQKLSPL